MSSTAWKRLCCYLRAHLDRSQRGSAIVEYALLLALVFVVCLVAVGLLGGSMENRFSSVAQSVGCAGPPTC